MSTLEKVIEVVERETGKPASWNTRLEYLDIDSLEFVMLMQAIASSVADIPDAEWASLDTVGDIAQACDQVLAIQ